MTRRLTVLLMCVGWALSAQADTIYLDSVGVGMDLPLCIDLDENGLSDQYEDAYSAGAGLDPDLDPDNDGIITRLEQLAGTHPNQSNSMMEIVMADLPDEASPSVAIEFQGGSFIGPTEFGDAGDTIQRVFRILAADDPDDPKVQIGAVTGLLSGTTIWQNVNATIDTDQRFYAIAVDYAGEGYTNDEEWAMFVQPRVDSNKYLVSVPVDYGDSNRLDSTLGAQLARGLTIGTVPSPKDQIRFYEDDGTYETLTLVTNPQGEVEWWTGGAKSTRTVEPGEGFEVLRHSGTRGRTNMVFLSLSRTSNVSPLAFTTNNPSEGWKWQLFGWPYVKPIASTGQVDPFGFANVGYGGSSSMPTAPHSARGDQIWVFDWDNQEWDYYWLIDGVSAALNGKWWDTPGMTNAFFSLRPGRGYFYRHHVDMGGGVTGTNFNWQPVMP